MKHSFAMGLCVGLLLALSLIASETAHATPFQGMQLGGNPGQNAFIHKTGSGCGWDYPCPPRPNYGLRKVIINKQRARTQFNIVNYGKVHINYYEGGARRQFNKRHHRRGRIADPCFNPGSWECKQERTHRKHGCAHHDCHGTGRCGPGCWYHKFKRGYCGHGCEFYGKKVKFEREDAWVQRRRPVWVHRKPEPKYDDFEAYDDYKPRNHHHHKRPPYDRPPYPVD